MNPKDLLDFDKIAELEKQVEQMENVGMKETIKENKPKDNSWDLNRLNTDYDGVGMSEDDAIEREHTPVEYYVEPQLPSEHSL